MKRDTSRYGTAGKPPKHSYYGEDVESLREAVIEAASKADVEELKAALSALGGDREDHGDDEDGDEEEPRMVNRDGKPAMRSELAEAHLDGVLNRGERRMLERHLEADPAKKRSVEASGRTCKQFAEQFVGTRADLKRILES
jgi:hypothetical protein